MKTSLLINDIIGVDEISWTVSLFGKNHDKSLVSNTASFAMQCHIQHASSLLKMSIGSMNQKTSLLKKNICLMFTTNPSLTNLGLNLDAPISNSAGHCY